jgi:putative ABC transport system permease protein
MHVLTIQRKREIGVLKALGASTGQVFSVIILEAVGFSLTGGLAGYVVVRGFFSLVMLYTDAGLFRVSLMTVESLMRVLLLTVGVALLSGLPPAYQAAFRTTTEVLRDES